MGYMGHKRRTVALQPSMRFFDSFGHRVHPGDEIEILHHYNFPHLNGRRARVHWNKDKGCLEWSFQETRRGGVYQTTENFFGVHTFKKVV